MILTFIFSAIWFFTSWAWAGIVALICLFITFLIGAAKLGCLGEFGEGIIAAADSFSIDFGSDSGSDGGYGGGDWGGGGSDD